MSKDVKSGRGKIGRVGILSYTSTLGKTMISPSLVTISVDTYMIGIDFSSSPFLDSILISFS